MKKRTGTIVRVLDGVRRRDPHAIARAISLLEDRAPGAATITAALTSRIGRAQRIGITGPPGVGKSTLIAQLAPQLTRAGRLLAIIAVDPTSPISGGAFLGDGVRMQSLVEDPRIFLRSLATRGAATGLSPATRHVADLLDAARFDPILIETVGAGQADWAITRIVRTTILVVTPGLGDTMQWLKAGLMELAHIIVVNKADHPGASTLVTELRRLYRAADPRRWAVPVISTVAERGTGVTDLARVVQHRRLWLAKHT